MRRGLSVTDAADRLGLSRPSFSNVVNGNAALSIPLALRLESEFQMHADRLLMDQLKQDIAEARAERKND